MKLPFAVRSMIFAKMVSAMARALRSGSCKGDAGESRARRQDERDLERRDLVERGIDHSRVSTSNTS